MYDVYYTLLGTFYNFRMKYPLKCATFVDFGWPLRVAPVPDLSQIPVTWYHFAFLWNAHPSYLSYWTWSYCWNRNVNLFKKEWYLFMCLELLKSEFLQLPPSTLFSKRNAHWFTPVLPVTLGHWPLPRVMSILSNSLDGNMQKTPFKKWQNQKDPRLGSVT